MSPGRASRAPLLLALALGVSLAPEAASAESPEVLYMLHCQGCHLPDGSGSPGAVPALGGSLARFLAVPGGRAFLVQVPGSASAPVSDAELAALLNWMVLRFGPEADARAAEPYGAEEVGRLRAQPLVEVTATRRSLVAEIARIRGSP